MNIEATTLEDACLLTPKVWGDDRGYFLESYKEHFFEDNGLDHKWIQDNESLSSFGVVRGLHYQLPPHGQAKLVRVVSGEVIDVIMDIRPESPTFGQQYSVILSGENKKQLLVPRGFAHGYGVLSKNAIFQYKVDNYYNKESERGIAFDDPALNINWHIPTSRMIISDKDKTNPSFADHHPYK